MRISTRVQSTGATTGTPTIAPRISTTLRKGCDKNEKRAVGLTPSTAGTNVHLMDLHDGTPFWPRRDGLPTVHDPLRTNETCDVVVIGGGITGSLVALELTKRGADVIVLDRRDAGGGSTSASTAMLQYEIDELLIDLTTAIGGEQAETAYRECARGIDLVERATQEVGHMCGFRRSPSVFMAVKAGDVRTLEQELSARADAGFEVQWLNSDQLRSRWDLVGVAAIESAAGGSIDPYVLCHHALLHVTKGGGRVYGRTDAVAFEFTSRRVTVQTSRDVTVRAKYAVFATGYEVNQLLPELPIALHSSFALVTQPIVDLPQRYPNGMLFWDYADPYIYGRTTDDSRLLIGGNDEPYRDPLRRPRAADQDPRIDGHHRTSLAELG